MRPHGTEKLASFRKRIIRGISMKMIDAPITDPLGSRPVLVVDEHDLVSDVLVKAGRTGGFANLFVLFEDRSFMSASMLPSASALREGEKIEAPVHQDTEIGLLMLTARQYKDGLSFPVELPGQSGLVGHAKELEMAN